MGNETKDLRDRSTEPVPRDRLDSWKEIAAHLNCSERTVRRWEQEGLPVHRHPHKKKAGIYAYKAEIDAWWNNGRVRLEELEQSRTSKRGYRSLRLVIALVTAVLSVVVLARFAYRFRGVTTSRRIESLAVLPLKNLSGDPGQDYFADGMTEQLTTDLGQISALRVISRTSAMRYKGPDKSVPEIGRELHVDAVVEGSVERSGDQVRITAQLIDAPNDKHLWAKSYERDLRDVLTLQDEVAQAIANEVKITLTPQEQSRLSSARPVNPRANEAYLRGMYELHGMTAETTETLKSQSLAKAVAYFQRALTNDPNEALAYSGLADAYSNLSTLYRAPLEVMPKAKAAAIKAIELRHAGGGSCLSRLCRVYFRLGLA